MNLTVAESAFLDAWEWESYLPSLFSPFTPPVKAPIDHPVKEFKHFVSFLAMVTLLYRENTLGVAPFLALTYLRITSYFRNRDPLEGPLGSQSPEFPTFYHVLQENITAVTKKLEVHLSPVLDALWGYLSESDVNSLQALGGTFLVLLLTLAFRLYGRRRRH